MKADFYFHQGLAVNTHRTYNSAQRQYLEFCEKHGLQAIPGSENTLRLFSSYLADRIKPQSIKVYLAAIRALHIQHGHQNPFTNTIKLQQTLRGIEREHIAPAKQKLPITFDILCKLHPLVDATLPDDITVWAAITSAHFLLLRASEFTVTDTPVPNSILCISDAQVTSTTDGDEYLALTIKKSKTDFGKGVVLYTGHTKHPVCAVCAMASNLKLQRLRPDYHTTSPLFQLSNGKPLSRRHLINFLSPLLRLVGLEPQEYSGHSFRIGGATSASVAGLQDYEIQMIGRWSSDCFKRYIRSPLSVFLRVATQIAETNTKPYQYANPFLPTKY